jgi:hypothetical protein
MVDWSAMIRAAVLDPLVVVLVLLIVGAVAAHLLFRRHPLSLAIVRVLS